MSRKKTISAKKARISKSESTALPCSSGKATQLNLISRDSCSGQRGIKQSVQTKFHLSRQAAGIMLTAAACLLFWFPYPYIHRSFLFNSYKVLSLRPTLISGFFALMLLLCLYVRGIFTIKSTSLTFAAFLTNLTLFATIFEIFISPEQNHAVASTVSPMKAALLAFCAAAILLGVREIAKTVFFLLISGMLFFRLKLVSDAMGIFGYITFLALISGLYLQESINVQNLKNDCNYLVNSATSLPSRL